MMGGDMLDTFDGKRRRLVVAIVCLLVLILLTWLSIMKKSPAQHAAAVGTCVAPPGDQPFPIAGTWTGTGTEVRSWDSVRPPRKQSETTTATRTFTIKASLYPYTASEISVGASRPISDGHKSTDLRELAASLSGFPNVRLKPTGGRVYSMHESYTGGQPTTAFERGAQELRGQIPRTSGDDVEVEATLTVTGDYPDSATLVFTNRSFKHATKQLVYETTLSYSLKVAPTADATRKRYIPVATNEQAAKLVSSPPPLVNPALLGKERGQVLVHALISEAGKVEAVWPISANNILLVDAATRALGCWSYRPATINGEHVGVETDINVRFDSKP
jgi:hypothetical protein